MSWSSNLKSTKEDDKVAENSKQKKCLPLAGKVVAVASLLRSSVKDCPENRENVVKLCHEAGAETTDYVSESVFCVIASTSAVAGETEEVCCAGWRMGIPVVKYWWINKCFQEGKILPFGKAQAFPPEPVKKKKKRSKSQENKEKAAASVNASEVTNDTQSKRRKKLPLASKVVAVSTLIESSVETSPENYKNVIQLCHEAGAETTGQVHKRVYCVIATGSAVAGSTQRVRKGWKLGIPIVKPEWLRQCIAVGKLVSFQNFLVPPVESTERAAPVMDNSKDTVSKEGWSEQVDLGCCCVCHENAKGVTDCEWCVSCSTNLAAAGK